MFILLIIEIWIIGLKAHCTKKNSWTDPANTNFFIWGPTKIIIYSHINDDSFFLNMRYIHYDFPEFEPPKEKW